MASPNEKQLQSTRAASEYQKAWFARLRSEVFEQKQPYAIVQADMPLELFQAAGVPVVSNQWWSALVSAKQLAPTLLDGMSALGFHRGLCRYCSLAMASTVVEGGAHAPWGGLPKPALLSARLTCDCIQRVFELWAEAFESPFVPLSNTGATHLPPKWWELSRHRWVELYEPHRLDLMTQELEALSAAIRNTTGRRVDRARLLALMEGVNRQEEYFEEVRELICRAPQSPVRLSEQIQNVMTAQWHRGSEWAISHARAFRDEVRDRVERGVAAYPAERLRLMWIGPAVWHDPTFYTSFEEKYGAVFVWSMYLAFGPDGYIRYGLDDPMRALASRVVSMNEQLRNPPWAGEWMVEQARRHRIHGALLLQSTDTSYLAGGTLFIERALEQAGIPTLLVQGDMVDARGWDGGAMRRLVENFLQQRVKANA